MAAKEQVTHMTMQIGEVAKRASLTVDAIRFYERRRLLPNPSRTAGRFRLYTEDAVKRLQFIQQMQSFGFSLKEVGELLKLRERKVDACESVKKTNGAEARGCALKTRRPAPTGVGVGCGFGQVQQRIESSATECALSVPRTGRSYCVRTEMKIEVLYIPGCPHHQPTVDRVRNVLASEMLADEVSEVPVKTEGEAQSPPPSRVFRISANSGKLKPIRSALRTTKTRSTALAG